MTRALTATERQRARRQRRRDGTRRVPVDVSPGTVAALIADGLLDHSEAVDPRRLGDTVSDILDCWAEGRLSSRLLRHAVTDRGLDRRAGNPMGIDSAPGESPVKSSPK